MKTSKYKRKKIFPLPLTKKFYLWIVVITFIPILIAAIIISVNTYNLVKSEKEKQIYTVVNQLNNKLETSFEDILIKYNALGKSREEQVRILNLELQSYVNDLAKTSPDVGMGYYSIKLDSILAINPKMNPFKPFKVSHSTPYFNIYKTGMPEFGKRNTSIAWNGKPIIWYAYPIKEKGKIIGHIWANVTTETILQKFIDKFIYFFGTWLIMVAALFWNAKFILKKGRSGLEDLANSIILEKDLPDTNLPELTPILKLIKEHNLKLKEQALALTSSEERFFKVFYLSPVAMSITDCQDHKHLYINKKFEQLTGFTHEETVGYTSADLNMMISTEEMANVAKDLKNNGFSERLIDIRHKSGNVLKISVFLELVDLDGQKVILAVLNDITQKLKIDRELKRMSKLNLIGEMAAGISHEIRNPLTTIRGFLQILGEKDKSNKLNNYYTLMIEELDRANNIISEFLSLAKDKVNEYKMHNLNQIIDHICPLLEADAIKQDKILLLELGDIPEILVDEKEIRQLILNLVRNGLDAMEPGKSILVRTYLEENFVNLLVQDQGKGIDTAALEKLGTPFFSTKDNGLGLGMAICFKIVEKHNANLDISTNSQGTTFSIKFKPI